MVGSDAKSSETVSEALENNLEIIPNNCEYSAVFPSLPLAIKWLRDRVQENHHVRFQVMLTKLENSKCQI